MHPKGTELVAAAGNGTLISTLSSATSGTLDEESVRGPGGLVVITVVSGTAHYWGCAVASSRGTRACHHRRVLNSEQLDRTRQDYDSIAQAYDDLVRHDDSPTTLLATAMVTAFADLVRAGGPRAQVLDVGCGPGHWTDHLDRLGVRACGVDLSPAMVAIARRYRPDLRYEVGSMLALDTASGALAGILAHFSLIHLPPQLVPAALTEFARVVEPGAPLLVGIQIHEDAAAGQWVPYDHRASPAYLWTLDAMATQLAAHGFAELARLRIGPPAEGKPPAGYLLTRYQPDAR